MLIDNLAFSRVADNLSSKWAGPNIQRLSRPFEQPIERMGLSQTLDKLSSEKAASSEWLRIDITFWTRLASCLGALAGKIKREDNEASGSAMGRYFVYFRVMVKDT